MSDYLTVMYNEKLRPFTTYPQKLTQYLFETFNLKSGMKLLEPGPGRGEILNNFKSLGLDVCGVDISEYSSSYMPDIQIKVEDIDKNGLPYEDNTFDVIYSKSFLEHMLEPEKFIKEAYRVLKPGGLFLSLVPDWDTQYITFYDDYTHKSPFTKISLSTIYEVHGFESVDVFKLRELPIVWKYPFLNYFCDIIAPFTPIRSQIKLFKWSRRLMLVASGVKPIKESTQ